MSRLPGFTKIKNKFSELEFNKTFDEAMLLMNQNSKKFQWNFQELHSSGTYSMTTEEEPLICHQEFHLNLSPEVRKDGSSPDDQHEEFSSKYHVLVLNNTIDGVQEDIEKYHYFIVSPPRINVEGTTSNDNVGYTTFIYDGVEDNSNSYLVSSKLMTIASPGQRQIVLSDNQVEIQEINKTEESSEENMVSINSDGVLMKYKLEDDHGQSLLQRSSLLNFDDLNFYTNDLDNIPTRYGMSSGYIEGKKIQVSGDIPTDVIEVDESGTDAYGVTYTNFVVNDTRNTCELLSFPKTLREYPYFTGNSKRVLKDGIYYEITTIRIHAGNNCTDLTFSILPTYVNSFQAYCFANCKNLPVVDATSLYIQNWHEKAFIFANGLLKLDVSMKAIHLGRRSDSSSPIIIERLETSSGYRYLYKCRGSITMEVFFYDQGEKIADPTEADYNEWA